MWFIMVELLTSKLHLLKSAYLHIISFYPFNNLEIYLAEIACVRECLCSYEIQLEVFMCNVLISAPEF